MSQKGNYFHGNRRLKSLTRKRQGLLGPYPNMVLQVLFGEEDALPYKYTASHEGRA